MGVNKENAAVASLFSYMIVGKRNEITSQTISISLPHIMWEKSPVTRCHRYAPYACSGPRSETRSVRSEISFLFLLFPEATHTVPCTFTLWPQEKRKKNKEIARLLALCSPQAEGTYKSGLTINRLILDHKVIN